MTYGTRVLSLPQPQDPYGAKYKGIWICLLILARALGGTYVNFGVFELYGDPALRVSATCSAQELNMGSGSLAAHHSQLQQDTCLHGLAPAHNLAG